MAHPIPSVKLEDTQFCQFFERDVSLLKSQGKMEESKVLRDHVLYWDRK